MDRKFSGLRFFILFGGILLILLGVLKTTQDGTAQSNIQPQLDHATCRAACMENSIFLHKNLGDSAAREFFHGWFEEYYIHTGCGDSPFVTGRDFRIDVVGEFVGAPGAYPLQCWQGLMASAVNCSDQCSGYSTTDGKYAPNIRVQIDSGGPGYVDVGISNQSHLEDLPELINSAYSRGYTLQTWLNLNSGNSLLVDRVDMPRLSYPNWITRGGVNDCILAYGEDDTRCELISYYAIPSIASHSVSFFDGGLYDLTSHVSNTSGVSDSFTQDGYVVLKSNGNHLTIDQGPYAGFY